MRGCAPSCGHQLRVQVVGHGLALLGLQTLLDAPARRLHHRGVRGAVLEALHVDLVVPDVERAHRRVVGHAFAVRAHQVGGHARRVAVGQVQVLRRDHDAGGQALEVPFEGRGQRLVQVVDVEDDVALGRGKGAEVHQVRVAAGLHAQAAARRGGQVGGHQRCRAAIEGEGRRRHAPEADRDQFGQASRVRFAQQFHRVAAALGRLPAGVRRARHRVAQGLALGTAVAGRQIGGCHLAARWPSVLVPLRAALELFFVMAGYLLAARSTTWPPAPAPAGSPTPAGGPPARPGRSRSGSACRP